MGVFETRITKIFGIKYPIMQGGMGAGYVSTAELVAAVGNAGGLGFMSAIQWEHNIKGLEDNIKKAKDLTDKPYGINVTLFEEMPKEFFYKVVDLIAKYQVPAVETSARKPDPWMKLLKQAGAKVIHKVARVRDGVTAERLGADALCIIGSEEGGHPGAERNPTIVVGPLLVDLVKIPVSIGGGFCDGRGLVAALALGGEAITMGTRFVASKECTVHENYKQAIVNMQYNETDYILMSIGDPVRCIRGPMSQAVLKLEFKEDKTELIKLLSKLKEQNDTGNMASNTGKLEEGMVPAGVVGGRIHEIKTCKQIVDDIMTEADVILEKLSKRKYWKA
ncbi:MAG: nitronate monooxygenase [Proteobacteria bacterium]|nr:nitronate monooxygenase [Pseudomonadota bacterium]